MPRRSPTLPYPTRCPPAGAPTQRNASRPIFTPLGFAFFRLVPIYHREPGEPPLTVVPLRAPLRTMTAFVSVSRNGLLPFAA